MINRIGWGSGAFILIVLFLVFCASPSFAQCTPEKDADMAKYEAKVNRGEDVQGCSQCAYLAMLFCSARHSVKREDVSRVGDLINKQKAVIRGMGTPCCPELLARSPQWGVAAGATTGTAKVASSAQVDLKGQKVQAMNTASSLVYDEGENPIADVVVNLANSELSRYATDEFSTMGIGLGVGLVAKALFKKRDRQQTQGAPSEPAQALSLSPGQEAIVNDYRTWGKIKQDLGNKILSVSSQVTSIAKDVETDIDAFRLTQAEEKVAKALTQLQEYNEGTQWTRLEWKLAEEKLEKKNYTTIPQNVPLLRFLEKLQALGEPEKARMLEIHNIKHYKSYLEVMVEPFIVLMKQSAEVAALKGDIQAAEKAYSIVNRLDKQGVLVDESRLRVLFLNGEIPTYIEECNKLIERAKNQGHTAQELRSRFMLIGAFKRQQNRVAALREVEACRQINNSLLSSQERNALDRAMGGKWAEAKTLPEEFIRNDYALTLEEINLHREFEEYDKAIAIATDKSRFFSGYKAGLNEVDFRYADFLKIEYLRALAEYEKQDFVKAEGTTNALYERRKNSYDIYYELNQVDVQTLKARIAVAQNKLDEARTHFKFMAIRNGYYLPLFEALKEYALKKNDPTLVTLLQNKISRLQLEQWTDEEEQAFKKSITQF